MRNLSSNVIEMLIGAILTGLGLMYLAYQYNALSKLAKNITTEIIEDRNVFQQKNFTTLDTVKDEEIYAAIMGYRDYPIMVDGKLIPKDGHDYELYFSYIKDGTYKKQYQYDTNRNITMIIYSYLGT